MQSGPGTPEVALRLRSGGQMLAPLNVITYTNCVDNVSCANMGQCIPLYAGDASDECAIVGQSSRAMRLTHG